MKHYRRHFITLLLALLLPHLGHTNQLEENTNYAVLDLESVVTRSKAYISLEKHIEKQRQIFSREAQQNEKSIYDQRSDLERKRTAMSEGNFEKQTQAIAQELQQLDSKYHRQRMTLHRSFNSGLERIQETISTIVNTMVQSHRYRMVLRKSTLIYSDPSDDITESVLTELDKRLTRIEPQ